MTRRRAILTDRERELLRDDDAGDQRYVVISRVRTKIQEELVEDVSILQENHPDLYEELRDVVCEGVQETAVVPEEPRREDPAASPPEPLDGETPVVADESDVEDASGVELPDPEEILDEVWRVVNEASANWDDDGERLDTRRKAAATALQYALDHDVHLGKSSDAVKAIREKYPVEDQNPETWWRKNVRDDVLSEVGDYSRGVKGYAVDSLDEA